MSNASPPPSVSKTKCSVPECEEILDYLPFKCKYCGRIYCKKHRLPENHYCTFEIKATPPPTPEPQMKSSYSTTTSYPNETKSRIDLPEMNGDTAIPIAPSRRVKRSQQSTRSTGSPFWSDESYHPFIYPSSNLNVTYTIITLNIVFFLLALIFGPEYFLLSIITLLPPYYFFHTILTGLFVPTDILSMIFSLLIFWNSGRVYEKQFGPKFLALLYLIPGIAALAMGLILQYILLITVGSDIFITATGIFGISANGGIFLGFVVFYCMMMGMESSINFLFFFVPIRLKAKYIIIFTVGVNIVMGILGLFGLGEPITPFANLSGMAAAYGIFKKYRSNLIPSQFYDRY